jgi:hypothetical protein
MPQPNGLPVTMAKVGASHSARPITDAPRERLLKRPNPDIGFGHVQGLICAESGHSQGSELTAWVDPQRSLDLLDSEGGLCL